MKNTFVCWQILGITRVWCILSQVSWPLRNFNWNFALAINPPSTAAPEDQLEYYRPTNSTSYKLHSLIITRGDLILTLSILNSEQGWICSFHSLKGVYHKILSLGAGFSNPFPAEDWAPILARWTCSEQFNAGEASHSASLSRQAKAVILVLMSLILTKAMNKFQSNYVWKNIWGFIDISIWHVCLQKCKILACNFSM